MRKNPSACEWLLIIKLERELDPSDKSLVCTCPSRQCSIIDGYNLTLSPEGSA